jgi:hypothetical protein
MDLGLWVNFPPNRSLIKSVLPQVKVDHSWAEIVSVGLRGFDERITKLFVQEQHERERLAEENRSPILSKVPRP